MGIFEFHGSHYCKYELGESELMMLQFATRLMITSAYKP